MLGLLWDDGHELYDFRTLDLAREWEVESSQVGELLEDAHDFVEHWLLPRVPAHVEQNLLNGLGHTWLQNFEDIYEEVIDSSGLKWLELYFKSVELEVREYLGSQIQQAVLTQATRVLEPETQILETPVGAKALQDTEHIRIIELSQFSPENNFKSFRYA